MTVYNKIIILTILFLVLMSVTAVMAQPWMKNIPEENRTKELNFYDVQKAFNQYWESKTIEKGKGWRQFKRWEYFMEPRVFPSGKLPHDIILAEYNKEKQKYPAKSLSGNWSHLGPDEVPLDFYGGPSGVGRINCITFHPSDANIMWLGAPSGGLWKTTDGGNNWITTTDDLPSIGVSDIAVNPDNPDIIYIATGDGDASDTYTAGVLKSSDGGATFTTTALNFTTSQGIIIRRLIINPDDTDILIAATNDGIYRTTDGGSSWDNVLLGHLKDIEFKPGAPGTVYVAEFSYYGGAQIFRSNNGGVTFSYITPFDPFLSEVDRIELAVTTANPSVIYALCSNSSDDGFHSLYKSSDSGNSWSLNITGSSINLLGWESSGGDAGGQGWYDLSLAVSPTNENTVFVGGVNIWKSTDGGFSFNINAHWWGDGVEYVHADQHMLVYNTSTNVLFSCNDGGIYKTSNGGSTWIDISSGIHILQIYRLGASATNESIVITGEQDNGSMKYNAPVWNYILGGDGMECIVDYTDENIIYATYYYGAIQKSVDGGYWLDDISPGPEGAWITPYVMHPTNHNTLYAGYDEVYKTIDGGVSWFTISSGMTGGENLRSLILAPSNPNYIYAATYDYIWRTTNGGSSCNDITSTKSL
ncbi:MAG: hypothetical protein HY738_12045 [Bacteroidia bacterium]|nr:hypothetical protein [Bacteroidia bacterium]